VYFGMVLRGKNIFTATLILVIVAILLYFVMTSKWGYTKFYPFYCDIIIDIENRRKNYVAFRIRALKSPLRSGNQMLPGTPVVLPCAHLNHHTSLLTLCPEFSCYHFLAFFMAQSPCVHL
jgi:hypothetical protein